MKDLDGKLLACTQILGQFPALEEIRWRIVAQGRRRADSSIDLRRESLFGPPLNEPHDCS